MDHHADHVASRAHDVDLTHRALVDDLRAVTDSMVRARLVAPIITRATEARDELAEVRRGAVAQAREDGQSWVAIGRELGVTPARAQAIVTGRTR